MPKETEAGTENLISWGLVIPGKGSRLDSTMAIQKEYLPILLESWLLPQFFVFRVTDLKFWLLAYFFNFLLLWKFHKYWTILIARPLDTRPRGVRTLEIHGFWLVLKTLEIHGFWPKALKIHGFLLKKIMPNSFECIVSLVFIATLFCISSVYLKVQLYFGTI